MLAWRRNAYLSCVRGQRCLAAPLLSWKLFACRTRCSELPKHNTQLCMSGLDTAAFMSHLFPCCREPSWKSLSQRASLGLFNFLHKCGGDCYIPPRIVSPFHCAPPVLCRSVSGWAMRLVFPLESTSRETNLNPLTENSYCSSWLSALLEIFSCIINTGKKKLFGKQTFQGLWSNKKQL